MEPASLNRCRPSAVLASVLLPEHALVLLDDLHPAAVGIADVEAAGVRCVVEGTAHGDAEPARSGEDVIESGGVDVEGDLVRVGAHAPALGGEEDQQNGADSEGVVRSGQGLRSEQVPVEGSEPDRILAAERDVVDAEHAHGPPAYSRTCTRPHVWPGASGGRGQ